MELAIGDAMATNPKKINRIDQRIDRVGTRVDIASGASGIFPSRFTDCFTLLDSADAHAMQENTSRTVKTGDPQFCEQSIGVVSRMRVDREKADREDEIKQNPGGEASATRDKDQDKNANSNTERFGIACEPDIWGRLRAQRVAARAGFQATALDYDWARQSLAATASKAWYQAVELRRLVGVNELAVRDYQELLRLSKVKQTAARWPGSMWRKRRRRSNWPKAS